MCSWGAAPGGPLVHPFLPREGSALLQLCSRVPQPLSTVQLQADVLLRCCRTWMQAWKSQKVESVAQPALHSLQQRDFASIPVVIKTETGEVTSSHSILMKKTPTEM